MANAVRHFKEKNLKPTSVSDWKQQYERELKDLQKLAGSGSDAVVVKSLPEKSRGRPPLLGKKCNELLKQLIVSMRSRGAPVGTSVIIGLAMGVYY